MFAVYRYHAVFTDSPEPMLQAEATHRDHAIIEQVIADLKDSALAHLPSGPFAANAAWLACAAIAYNLTRAAGALASTFHARARTATIRAQLIDVPARIARSAHRLTAAWPQLQLPPRARPARIATRTRGTHRHLHQRRDRGGHRTTPTPPEHDHSLGSGRLQRHPDMARPMSLRSSMADHLRTEELPPPVAAVRHRAGPAASSASAQSARIAFSKRSNRSITAWSPKNGRIWVNRTPALPLSRSTQ